LKSNPYIDDNPVVFFLAIISTLLKMDFKANDLSLEDKEV
jgi:hypothetical protein